MSAAVSRYSARPVCRIRAREAVQGPGQAPAPAGVAPVALMGGLAQALARVAGRTGPRAPWSRRRAPACAGSSRSAGGRCPAGARPPSPAPARKIVPTFIMMSMNSEAGSTNERRYWPCAMKRIAIVRPAWTKHGLDALRRAAQVQPAQVGGEEQKAEVMHGAVVLALFQRRGVGDGPVQPLARCRCARRRRTSCRGRSRRTSASSVSCPGRTCRRRCTWGSSRRGTSPAAPAPALGEVEGVLQGGAGRRRVQASYSGMVSPSYFASSGTSSQRRLSQDCMPSSASWTPLAPSRRS